MSAVRFRHVPLAAQIGYGGCTRRGECSILHVGARKGFTEEMILNYKILSEPLEQHGRGWKKAFEAKRVPTDRARRLAG